MKKIIIVLVFIFSQFSNACNTLYEAQKIALLQYKFVLVNIMESEGTTNRKFFMLEKEDLGLMSNYVCLNLYKGQDNSEISKCKIYNYPTLLIIDGNGVEIYRYANSLDLMGFKPALENFNNCPVSLINDLKSFNEKNNYYSAIRIAQSYLDYSLSLEANLKFEIYHVCDLYLKKAISLVKKSDKLYDEKIQKMEILMKFKLAYQKNFPELNEQLSYDDKFTFESNKLISYFLRYINSKSQNTNELASIESKIKQYEGFEDYIKKADLILSQEF
ncbi:MAG: hypothetical protein H7174_10795 [Flavobacterium sp.]|nr:hypothetical protein [Flavobacterium sp.]